MPVSWKQAISRLPIQGRRRVGSPVPFLLTLFCKSWMSGWKNNTKSTHSRKPRQKAMLAATRNTCACTIASWTSNATWMANDPCQRMPTPEELRRELREKLRLRNLQPRCLPRKVTYYCRYADDFLVMLCDASKAEALQMKAAITEWMKTNLGLTLNQDKTHITHWQDKVRFLGYELEGRRNRNGTGWLHLGIPRDAVRNVVAKVQQATRYSQAPEYDVFRNVNAIARGWMNYYRYAHNNNVTGGKLSMVIYWRTVHYLGKRHRPFHRKGDERPLCQRPQNRLSRTLRQHARPTPDTRKPLLHLAQNAHPAGVGGQSLLPSAG